MSVPVRGRIVLVAGDESLTYLMERYTERSGLGMDVLADPPPIDALLARGPSLVWFPSLESLGRWRARGRTGADEPAVVVCTSVPDDRRARELEADYCALLPLTYDDFRAAVSAVGLTGGRGR